MTVHDFQVHVSGGTVSIDAWREAKEAAEDVLPSLNDAQREAARKIGMTEIEYARGILADEIAKKSQEERGKRLGEIIKELLNRAGQGWELCSLVRRGIDQAWVARFEASGRASQVEIPLLTLQMMPWTPESRSVRGSSKAY